MCQSTGPMEEFWSACFGGAPVPDLLLSGVSSVVLRRRLPTVQTVQMQYIDKVVDVFGVFWSLVEAKMHVKVSIGSCAILGENSVTVGLRSSGVWRSLRWESVFLGCRAELLKPVEIPQVQFLGWWRHARCVQTVLGSRRAENCGFSQLQSRQGADVLARAVH